MSATIIVEITNKLLRHVSTHEVSSSGSSLRLAKITYELMLHIRPHTQFCDSNQFYELFNEF